MASLVQSDWTGLASVAPLAQRPPERSERADALSARPGAATSRADPDCAHGACQVDAAIRMRVGRGWRSLRRLGVPVPACADRTNTLDGLPHSPPRADTR